MRFGRFALTDDVQETTDEFNETSVDLDDFDKKSVILTRCSVISMRQAMG